MTAKVNYDVAFCNQIATLGKKDKLLLHVCCSPCATYCLTRLLQHFDVTLFFANDNVTDKQEYDLRLSQVQKLVDVVNAGKYEVKPKYPVKLVALPQVCNNFFDVVKDFAQEREGGQRCNVCFELRLRQTRDYARQYGFDYFCTTLTVSPYKNSQLLNQIGNDLASDDLTWLNADFKKHDGYNQSVALSNKYELYRQHYCGCCYSLAQMQNATKESK